MSDKLDKEFRLGREDAAEFLREIADSIEEGDTISLDGDDWKVFQKFEEILPFRVYSDTDTLEFGFQLLNPDSNQK